MKANRTNGRGRRGSIARIRSSTLMHIDSHSIFILKVSTPTISKYWERILAGWMKIGMNLVAPSRDMIQYMLELEPGTRTIISIGELLLLWSQHPTTVVNVL